MAQKNSTASYLIALQEINLALKEGRITYDEAESRAKAFLIELNADGIENSKKFELEHTPISFDDFIKT